MAEIKITEEDSLNEDKKTPLKFSKNSKARGKRLSRKKKILLVLGVIFVILGFFGFKMYSTLSKIFAENGLNIPGLLGDIERLEGEKSGRVNVLLLGIGDQGHSGQNLSDTIMVVSLDVQEKKVAMVSIPRDMYVNIPGYGYAKINEAHSHGEEKRIGGGPEKAKETVAQTLDLPIHYYARVDFSGLSKIIDAVGGIDINVEEDIYDPYYPDGGTYSIEKGQHHLTGEEALKYARSRYTTSDFDRAKRQQQIILAVKEKTLSSSTVFNPKKVLDIMTVVGDHIKTDFQLAELKRINELTSGIGTENVIRKVIDNNETKLLVSGNVGGASVLQPATGDLREIRTYVRDIFRGDDTLSAKDTNINLGVVNSTGVAGAAASEVNRLVEQGFENVVAESGSVKDTTVIYDYTGGSKKNILDYLASKYKAEVVEMAQSGSYDVKIVLGSNFTSN